MHAQMKTVLGLCVNR